LSKSSSQHRREKKLQEEFIKWYSSMQLGTGADIQPVRWSQVQAVAKAPSAAELTSLVGLAFKLKQPESSKTAIRTKFSNEAPAPGDAELTMLAASSLAVAMQGRGAIAAKTAGLVMATTAVGQRVPDLPMPLVAMAEQALSDLAETARRRPQALSNQPAPVVNVKGALEASPAFDQASVHAVFNSLGQEFQKALQAIVNRQKQFETAVQGYIKVQDEELNVLWWLHGGHSELANVPFGELPAAQRPLVLAAELSDLSTVLPGPPSLAALLSRAGVEQNAVTSVEAAVDALPVPLLKELLPDSDHPKVSPATTPILEAVRRRLEIDGQGGWTVGWNSVTGLAHKQELSALKFAQSAFLELSLVRLG
jgi:hypothetical protein